MKKTKKRQKEKSEAKIMCCEFMQYLDYYPLEKLIKKIELFTKGEHPFIKKYAFIVHDKDEAETLEKDEIHESEQDEKRETSQVSLKLPHFHCIMEFSQQMYFSKLANYFQTEVQRFQRIGKQGNSKSYKKSAYEYLIHKNDVFKYQYKISEVSSNFNYESYVKAEQNVTEDNIREFLEQNPNLPKKTVERKFAGASCKVFNFIDRQYDNLSHTKNVREIPIKVIYICGPTGKGKTCFAKALAEIDYTNDEICISSASNDIFQDFQMNQKCLIVDEFRDTSLRFDDLLKVTDNYASATIRARFKNPSLITCEVIIFTSCKKPDELYPEIQEDREQFYRRFDYKYIYHNGVSWVKMIYDEKAKKFVPKNTSFSPKGIEFNKWVTDIINEKKALSQQYMRPKKSYENLDEDDDLKYVSI